MGEDSRRIPNVLLQPPSVDFIQNRLPSIDPAFERLQSLQYDQSLTRFVPTASDTAVVPWPQPSSQDVSWGRPSQRLPVRELVPAVSVMAFWDKIMGQAMAKLETDKVPKKLVGNVEYAIRGLYSWREIYEKLQSAREKFDGTKSKFLGRFKKTYRYLADKSDDAARLVSALPDSTYVSPVKTALEVLLDVSLRPIKVVSCAERIRSRLSKQAQNFGLWSKTHSRKTSWRRVLPRSRFISPLSRETKTSNSPRLI